MLPDFNLALPLLGTFLIGLSKASLASGLGMLTTPLLATAMPARLAIGVVLPLLCFADGITILAYWKKWDWSRVWPPLLGVTPGIALGMLFVKQISDRSLQLSIGITALVLTLLLLIRQLWFPQHVYHPKWWHGALVGALAGFSSTISHGAGPILAIYLAAQGLPKQSFIASSALFFTVNNLLKVPPYIFAGLINQETLKLDLFLFLVIPLGVWIGYRINSWIPQKAFGYLVLILLFLTSVKLIFPS